MHVAGIIADDGIWIGVEVVHEHGGPFDCLGRGGSLFGSDFVEGGENARVAGTAIVHEGSIDGLDAGGAMFVKRLGLGFGSGTLWLA